VVIADVEAALGNVQDFIAVLERSEHIWNTSSNDTPEWKQADRQLHEQLPLILQIAERVDPSLRAKLQADSYGWPYHQCREASQELAGHLGSLEEAQRILGPTGPQLAAARLHPWIWNAAISLRGAWSRRSGNAPGRWPRPARGCLDPQAGSHGSVHSCTAAPSTLARPRNFRTNASSPAASVKYQISSARAGSGNPRSCASSSSENTSLVATGVPSPEEQTPMENT
jgi:hypothetical protein